MHVIVGQGQLDSILQATPEGRRGFIEEAAGVLKHRKRKEKALRKLEACEGNLNRLSDLITEIRRQLKPLGRQAEVARKAAVIQAELRDAKARLLADDLVQAHAGAGSPTWPTSRPCSSAGATLEDALEQARAAEVDAEEAVRAGVPRLTARAGDLVLAGRAEGAGRHHAVHRPGADAQRRRRSGRAAGRPRPRRAGPRGRQPSPPRRHELAAEVAGAGRGAGRRPATRRSEPEQAHQARGGPAGRRWSGPRPTGARGWPG